LLRKGAPNQPLTDEQNERKLAIFNILISLFERAYLLVFEEKMDHQTQRLTSDDRFFPIATLSSSKWPAADHRWLPTRHCDSMLEQPKCVSRCRPACG
jgi:hypothetical protein